MLRGRAAQGPGWHEPGQPAGLPAHWAADAIPPPPQADPREAFVAAGLAWVTPHVLRETVAILMDHASLSSRAAAGQLGHANASMTTDIDFGRKPSTTGPVPETLETSTCRTSRKRRNGPRTAGPLAAGG